jgi:predicted transport protein
MGVKLIKPLPLVLKGHAALDERWVQQQIAEDPALLGIEGDLFLRDKERRQPRAGRLDLLLEDRETRRRYEVEVQLGPTDEAHIIRCIEYWDIERRRYPQYEHCAVLVAEDITSRFLNVISLLNGQIPLIAIQLRAVTIGTDIALIPTRVVDEFKRGFVDDEEETVEKADRQYWEERATPATMKIADEIFDIARTNNSTVSPNYNKHYIGMLVNDRPTNFIFITPKKQFCKLSFRLQRTQEVDDQIESSGIELIGYREWGAYEVRIGPKDLEKHRALIAGWIKQSYTYVCS